MWFQSNQGKDKNMTLENQTKSKSGLQINTDNQDEDEYKDFDIENRITNPSKSLHNDDRTRRKRSSADSVSSSMTATSTLVSMIGVLLLLPLMLPGNIIAWIQSKGYMQQSQPRQQNNNKTLKLKKEKSKRKEQQTKNDVDSTDNTADEITEQQSFPPSITSLQSSLVTPVSSSTPTTVSTMISPLESDCHNEDTHYSIKELPESSRINFSWMSTSIRSFISYPTSEGDEDDDDNTNEDVFEAIRRSDDDPTQHTTMHQNQTIEKDNTKRKEVIDAVDNTRRRQSLGMKQKRQRQKKWYHRTDPEIHCPLIVIGALIFLFGLAVYLGIHFSNKNKSNNNQSSINSAEVNVNDNNTVTNVSNNTLQYQNDTIYDQFDSKIKTTTDTNGKNFSNTTDSSIVNSPKEPSDEWDNYDTKSPIATNLTYNSTTIPSRSPSVSYNECIDDDDSSFALLYNTTNVTISFSNETIIRKYDCNWLQKQTVDAIIDICINPMYYYYYYSSTISEKNVYNESSQSDDDTIVTDDDTFASLQSANVLWLILQQLNQYCQATCSGIGGRIYDNCYTKDKN